MRIDGGRGVNHCVGEWVNGGFAHFLKKRVARRGRGNIDEGRGGEKEREKRRDYRSVTVNMHLFAQEKPLFSPFPSQALAPKLVGTLPDFEL